jgi:hypothetical protein
VRRRIILAVLAAGGGAAALALGISPASGKSGLPPHVVQVKCTFNLTTEPPPGTNAVVAPEPKGVQDGNVYCPTHQFGKGAIRDHFVTAISGNTVGNFTEYFDTGSVVGTLTLVPQGGSFSGGGFQAQNYDGHFNVTYGTGAFHGVKSSQPGGMYCKSPDSIHLSCTETMTIVDPAS